MRTTSSRTSSDRACADVPDGASSARPGDEIALRVLAHEPVLLLQNLDARDAKDDGTSDVAMHWSRDAMELARRTVVEDGRGTQTFTTPILELASAAVLESTPLDAAVDVAANRDVAVARPVDDAGADDRARPAGSGVGRPADGDRRASRTRRRGVRERGARPVVRRDRHRPAACSAAWPAISRGRCRDCGSASKARDDAERRIDDRGDAGARARALVDAAPAGDRIVGRPARRSTGRRSRRG